MHGQFDAYGLILIKEKVITQGKIYTSEITTRDENHEEFLEKALLLLDANIRHINYLAGEKQVIGDNSKPSDVKFVKASSLRHLYT
jgi:hypothetical protein